MKYFSLFLLLVAWLALLPGIEVSGHITEDTTWTPENNPYIVTGSLQIDAGVILTILPGVNIRIVGASLGYPNSFQWNGNNEPTAKMIIGWGQINAIGTEDSPITFNVHSEDENFRWGGIYIGADAPMSSFVHCVFQNSYACDVNPGLSSIGAIQFENGIIHVRHCTFIDNAMALRTFHLSMDLILYDCKFICLNPAYPPPFEDYQSFLGIHPNPSNPPLRPYELTIAKCYFKGESAIGGGEIYVDNLFLNNFYDHVNEGSNSLIYDRTGFSSASSYGNYTLNGDSYANCVAWEDSDIAFYRKNTLIKYPDTFDQYPPLRIGSTGRGTNHVAENILLGAVQFYTSGSRYGNSMIYNNLIKTGNELALYINQYENTDLAGETKIFNNLIVNTNPDSLYFNRLIYARDSNLSVFNNTFSTFYRGLETNMSVLSFYNNIFHRIQEAPSYGFSPDFPNIYGYNCTNLPIPLSNTIIDTGENIVADPSFVDEAAGDYRLQAGSVCIDAGLNLPDLPAFDIRYHKRMAPGTEDGIRNVDMGAYEYNSIYIGGIRAFIYDAESGLPLDCVKAQILNKLPEFSDSLGTFHYPSGAGSYTMNLSRWDYETSVVENIIVSEGEDIILHLPLQREVVANPNENNATIPQLSAFTNYPNPFNPQTRISYILPSSGKIRLSIYNLKGQKLITLSDAIQVKGHHSVIWNGKDQHSKNVATGIYFARLEYAGRTEIRKMMLVK